MGQVPKYHWNGYFDLTAEVLCCFWKYCWQLWKPYCSCSVHHVPSSGRCHYSSSLILHNKCKQNSILYCKGNAETLLYFILIVWVGLLIMAFLRTIDLEIKKKNAAEVSLKVLWVYHYCRILVGPLYWLHKKAAMAQRLGLWLLLSALIVYRIWELNIVHIWTMSCIKGACSKSNWTSLCLLCINNVSVQTNHSVAAITFWVWKYWLMDVWLLQNYHLPTCNNAENIDSDYCLPMTGKVIHVVGYLCGFFNNEGWTGFMPSLRNKSSADKKGCWICQPLYRYVPI